MSENVQIRNIAEVMKILSDESRGDEIVEVIKNQNRELYESARILTERILQRHPVMAMLVKQNQTERFHLAYIRVSTTDHKDFPSNLSAQNGLINFGASFEVDPACEIMTYYAAIPTDEIYGPAGIERAIKGTKELLLKTVPKEKQTEIMGMLPIGVSQSFFNYQRKGRLFAIWKVSSHYDPLSYKTCYVHGLRQLENFRIFPFQADKNCEYLALILTQGDTNVWPSIELKFKKHGFSVDHIEGNEFFDISFSTLRKLNLMESLLAVTVDMPNVEESVLREQISMVDYSTAIRNELISGASNGVERISSEVIEINEKGLRAAQDAGRFMFRTIHRIDPKSQENYCIRRKDLEKQS